MAQLKIEYRNTEKVYPYANNARTHSDTQVEQIAASIKEFGFTNPVLIDESDTIIAGHGRVMAAKLLGLEKVPCIKLSNLSERQKRAYILADNKIALNSGWDFEKLSDELSLLAETEYDLSLTGFAEDELDALLKADSSILPDQFGQPERIQVSPHTRVVSGGNTEDDHVPESPDTGASVSRVGDVWVLSSHRLMCGDSTNVQHVAALMAGKKADMVFTDPPYNVKISGIGSGNNSVISSHGEFVMASGEMDQTEFTNFLKKIFTNLASNSKDGAIHFVCMDWRHMQEVLDASAAYSQQGGGGEVLVGSQTANSLE